MLHPKHAKGSFINYDPGLFVGVITVGGSLFKVDGQCLNWILEINL